MEVYILFVSTFRFSLTPPLQENEGGIFLSFFHFSPILCSPFFRFSHFLSRFSRFSPILSPVFPISGVSRFVSPLCFPFFVIPVATNPVALVALPCRVEVPEPVEKMDDLGLEDLSRSSKNMSKKSSIDSSTDIEKYSSNGFIWFPLSLFFQNIAKKPI